jgi:phage terminase large subunit GpA-like protein
VRADGRYIRRGIKVWPLNVSTLKSELYGQLRLERPTVESGSPFPPGYCHFPEFSEEFFRQITAEELHTKIIRGYPRQEWVKLRRNEVLDTRGDSRGAASAVGIDRFQERHWAELEAMLRVEEAPLVMPDMPVSQPSVYGQARRQRPQIRLGGF